MGQLCCPRPSLSLRLYIPLVAWVWTVPCLQLCCPYLGQFFIPFMMAQKVLKASPLTCRPLLKDEQFIVYFLKFGAVSYLFYSWILVTLYDFYSDHFIVWEMKLLSVLSFFHLLLSHCFFLWSFLYYSFGSTLRMQFSGWEWKRKREGGKKWRRKGGGREETTSKQGELDKHTGYISVQPSHYQWGWFRNSKRWEADLP